ncbi:MAG: ATP-binding protein [Candidatus Nanopelagicales bacterium]
MPILLAHTLDDQAETVLLRLARGSGARSLSPWRRWTAISTGLCCILRRSLVRAACPAPAHEDPHNADDRFARARLRGHGSTRAGRGSRRRGRFGLARSAALREDNAALDAVRRGQQALTSDVAELAALPRAVRLRVLRRLALAGRAAGR